MKMKDVSAPEDVRDGGDRQGSQPRMADVFDGPLWADIFDPDCACLVDDSGDAVGVFPVGARYAVAAAHAINCHDEAMRLLGLLAEAYALEVGPGGPDGIVARARALIEGAQ